MKAGHLPLRARPRPICQLCGYTLQQPAHRRSFVALSAPKAPSMRRQLGRQLGRQLAAFPRASARSLTTAARAQELEPEIQSEPQFSDRIAELRATLADVEQRINAIYSSPKVEPESAVLGVLDALESIARQAIAIRSRQPLPAKINIRQSSAGAILSLDSEEPEADGRASSRRASKQKSPTINHLPSPSYLSKLGENLLKHEKVFISPNVLAVYIHLQRLLARPRAIPEILHLYANKPIPELNSSPPKYSKPSPKAAKQAIPKDLADEALTAAIEAKDLPLALDVIQVTYCAPAWRRHRIITKLGLPGTIATLTPIALYMIAQEFSVYSGYIDPWMFKMYSFAGLLTYVGCTGTLGFVALTTYNDHHDRVVWRPGMPLLDRYLREDERAALDRIACAWGFKEEWRRGDEEGEEWEGLKEWISLRGMILDKPDLMPGMNA